MSWYVSFYVGYMLNGKVYPYGPFDYKGHYNDIHCTSRSFTTDLKYYFTPISKVQLSQEIIDAVFDIDMKEDTFYEKYIGICKLSDLPEGNFIKSGYYLIEDIKKYKEDEDSDVFCERLDPEMYTIKLENELKFGKPTETTDEYGEKCAPYSCADYAYFMYVDYSCIEYEIFKIKTIVHSITSTGNLPEGAEIVLFKTEG